MSGGKIRVLIVDDSASARQAFNDILNSEPDIEVMGVAGDAFAAARRIQAEIPDVILLDIELPRMDGLTLLRKIMAQRPMPVIICSNHVEEGSRTFADAMDAGAVDIIIKPRVATKEFLAEARVRVCDAVRAAASAKLRKPKAAPMIVHGKLTADAVLPPPKRPLNLATERIVCIGASTGGTEALRDVLMALPAESPGVVIVQHMPERFTAAFAQRLDGLCHVTVKEAQDGDAVRQGLALIAPGNRHMMLRRNGSHYFVSVCDGPLVSRHRPSVDVLFRSAAQCAGANALGVIMTGMGDDGAKGLLEMRTAGAATIAQDEESCVVFGMPKQAITLGAAGKTLPLGAIAREILQFAANGD